MSELLNTKAAVPLPGPLLDTTVGRLSFVARACRWGFTFLQDVYDNLFVYSDAAPPDVLLSAEARADVEFR